MLRIQKNLRRREMMEMMFSSVNMSMTFTGIVSSALLRLKIMMWYVLKKIDDILWNLCLYVMEDFGTNKPSPHLVGRGRS